MDIAGGYEYYDCSTFGWMTYLENATMYGYKAGGSVTPTYSDPITVLVRDESTVQARMLSLDDEYE